MTVSIDKGFTDSPPAGAGTLNIPFTQNYAEEYRLLSDSPGEVVMTNVDALIDQPATVRVSQRKVQNVYANSDVDASAYPAVKAGTATLVERREIWAEIDSEDATYRKLLPVKCGITLTVPQNGTIDASMVSDLVLRTLQALFESGDTSTAGLNALLHGVLCKKDVQ